MQKSVLRRTLTALAAVSSATAIVVACGGDGSTTVTPPQNDAATATCSSPLAQCGAACTDLQSDPTNCGTCGTKCDTAKAQVCSQGKCALACGGGTTQCGSSCFDTQVDPNNCGACGTKCAAGEQCGAGKCVVACGTGLTLCPGGEGGAASCVNAQTDDLNCGACGVSCQINQKCGAGTCVANLTTLPPTDITNGLANCNTTNAQIAHKTAIDDLNGMAVLMRCGGEAFVVTSATGGLTWSKPVTTGLKNLQDVTLAVSHGSKPALYVAAVDGSNNLVFTQSTNGGSTWSAPVVLDAPLSASNGLRVDSYNGTVYVSARTGGTVHILRDGQGAGDAGLVDAGDAGFAVTTVAMNFAYGDVMVDQSNGDVWFASDQPSFQLVKSTNGGLSFGAILAPPGSLNFSDWTLNKSTIYAAAVQDQMYAIPTSAPTTSTSASGLGGAPSQQRSIAADTAGNAYVGTGQGASVKLTKVPFGAPGSDAGADAGLGLVTVQLGNTANANDVSVAANAPNATLYAFTLAGKVWAGVQRF